MERERREENDIVQSYNLTCLKYQLQFGEEGGFIVDMISQYISEGWMDHGQGMMMLKAIFEPELDDTGGEHE